VEHFISSWGYVAVFVLMLGESACVPIPSEVIMSFAGALVAAHRLDFAGALAAGVVGELAGAYLSWAVGRTGGRALVERYGRYVLLTKSDLDRAERWFSERGEVSVLVGRVLPVVRTFISVPAGIAEMSPLRFGVFTVIGSAVWDGMLLGVGYALGSRWSSITHGFNDAGYVLAGLVVLAIAGFVVHRWRAVRAEHTADVAA
jgi:membrane protein DedA with SNARE-associated domain